METLTALPAIDSGRKFGAVPIGYDKIIIIREEFSTLAELTKLFVGNDADALTVKRIQALTSNVQEQANALTDADVNAALTALNIPEAEDKTAVLRFLALAVAMVQRG